MRKNQILTLIESDLLNFKLLLACRNNGGWMRTSSDDLPKVIFKLIGIKKKKWTEDLYNSYFELVREVKHLDLQSHSDRTLLSKKIYKYLLGQI